MMQLLLKALKHVTKVPSDSVELFHDGQLVFLRGPLRAANGTDPLVLPRWGVAAPPQAVGLRIQVEVFRPLRQWSWRRLFCPGQTGEWCEGVAEVSTEEAWVPRAQIGEFELKEDQLFHLNGWEPFVPEQSERLSEVLSGARASALGEAVHGVHKAAASATAPVTGFVAALGFPMAAAPAASEVLGFAPPLPIPSERPDVYGQGWLLYYPRGGGHKESPKHGDLRVCFLHLPGGNDQHFSAVGVQRGCTLEPFRYRAPPPKGLSIGPMDTVAFNVGNHDDTEEAEEEDALPWNAFQSGGAVWQFRSDDGGWVPFGEQDGYELEALYNKDPSWSGRRPLGEKRWKYKIDFRNMTQVNPKTQRQRKLQRRLEESNWLSRMPLTLRVALAAMQASAEGWRVLLHRAAPEALPCLAPGSHWIWSYFLRAHRRELWLTWRLRVFGFMLMTAGLEVAFWQWQARLLFLGGMFVNYALWAIALVGAGGFTAFTAAAASLFYQPLAASLYLVSAGALFMAILGWTGIIVALCCVGACMGFVTLLFAVHMILPC